MTTIKNNPAAIRHLMIPERRRRRRRRKEEEKN